MRVIDIAGESIFPIISPQQQFHYNMCFPLEYEDILIFLTKHELCQLLLTAKIQIILGQMESRRNQ